MEIVQIYGKVHKAPKFKWCCFLECKFEGIYHYLADDEGEDLGGKIGKSLNDCEDYCKEMAGCNSFSYCDGEKVCRIKDKLPIGKRTESDSCTTFYRSCDAGF